MRSQQSIASPKGSSDLSGSCFSNALIRKERIVRMASSIRYVGASTQLSAKRDVLELVEPNFQREIGRQGNGSVTNALGLIWYGVS